MFIVLKLLHKILIWYTTEYFCVIRFSIAPWTKRKLIKNFCVIVSLIWIESDLPRWIYPRGMLGSIYSYIFPIHTQRLQLRLLATKSEKQKFCDILIAWYFRVGNPGPCLTYLIAWLSLQESFRQWVKNAKKPIPIYRLHLLDLYGCDHLFTSKTHC